MQVDFQNIQTVLKLLGHDSERLCSMCDGSGEGRVDGQSCRRCRGSGLDYSDSELQDLKADEARQKRKDDE